MNLIDSCGWIEFFTDGPLAIKYDRYITNIDKQITSPIVIYEVYKLIKSQKSEEDALEAIVQVSRGRIVEINQEIALVAADASIKYNIPMADAFIYATGIVSSAKIIISDIHFKNLPNIIYLS